MLKYTAFKLSVNTMYPTLTQALIALRMAIFFEYLVLAYTIELMDDLGLVR